MPVRCGQSPERVPRSPGRMVRRLRCAGDGGAAAGRVMTAEALEHSIRTIVQDPCSGTDGMVRVTCTCGELREESPYYGTGLGDPVSQELHHQGVTVPEAMARGLLAAVHAHGEGHWTAPPQDEAVQRDLARAAGKLTSGASAP